MNVHFSAPRRRWPARLVDLAVVVVLLALAAATFVLSYTGVHVIALQEGVSPRFARVYPGTFDAVLVIACVAALVLRDARWWARVYAWLAIIATMAVVGTADAVHAMNIALPHQKMEGVVAAVPWVLVLIGFSLMLTILRHPRPRHAAAEPASGGDATGATEQIALPSAAIEVDESAAQETTDAPPEALPAEPTSRWRVADSGPARSWHEYWDAETDNAPVEPSSPPAPAAPSGESNPTAATTSRERDNTPTTTQTDPGAAGGAKDGSGPGAVDVDAPPIATAPFATLNRVRSTPTPPEEDEE